MTMVEDHHVTVSSGQYFAESARKFFGNIKLGFHADDDADAELMSAPLGACRLSRITASPHGVKATRVVQRSHDVDSIKLILQLEGQSIFEQDGKAFAFGPKSWIVYDPTRPYQLNNQSRISQLLLQVPRNNFSAAALERLSLPHVFCDDPAGVPRVVAAFVRTTMDEIARFEELEASRVGDSLARLATMMISSDQEGDDSCTLRILRARVKAYIENNLARSDLDIEEIAQRMGCSRRYIFRAFQAADTTPSQYIWDLRLERTRERLTASSFRNGSISEVAFSCGFSSTAHFSRAFRKRYGMSPSDARKTGV
ncbi:MAG: AraC family transcriptional regulator [Pseudomonadota bacterium]